MTSLESIRQMIEIAGIQPTIYQLRWEVGEGFSSWIDLPQDEYESMQKLRRIGDQFRILYAFDS